MAALSITSLFSFFEEETKSIQKGENHYHSSHVESFVYSQAVIRGLVHASMKKKVYRVTVSTHRVIVTSVSKPMDAKHQANHISIPKQIYLDSKNDIKSAECECPRGKFKCSHAAALFIHGIHNLSRTDVECQWRKRKAADTVKSVPEMFPKPKKYIPITRQTTNEDRKLLYEVIWTVHRSLLDHEPGISSSSHSDPHS